MVVVDGLRPSSRSVGAALARHTGATGLPALVRLTGATGLPALGWAARRSLGHRWAARVSAAPVTTGFPATGLPTAVVVRPQRMAPAAVVAAVRSAVLPEPRAAMAAVVTMRPAVARPLVQTVRAV
jgi:hypothetical protein